MRLYKAEILVALPENQELNELMQRAAGGDEAAFRRFYDLCSPSILAFLIRLLKDRFHAEDVLQDAMVIAWKSAPDFDQNLASARTWITTIARRRAIDQLRSHQRQQEILREGAGDIRSTMGLDNSSLENDKSRSEAESRMTENRLAFCFDELSGDAATCIRFAYLDGLTFPEISRHIDRSLGTVKSWVRRGLQSLRECMQR